MIYKYLFLIEGDYIDTFHYRDGRFEIIKYKGNNSYIYDNQFWTWWETITSYIDSICDVEFCFIVEENSSINITEIEEHIKKYRCSKNSFWNKDILEKFITNKFIESKIIFKNNNNNYNIKNSIISNSIKSFNIITYPINKNILTNRFSDNSIKENLENSKIKNESIIANYYRRKTSKLK